jgi:hypothetical protein
MLRNQRGSLLIGNCYSSCLMTPLAVPCPAYQQRWHSNSTLRLQQLLQRLFRACATARHGEAQTLQAGVS